MDLHFKVIIPFYNVAPWIEKTIGSILSQTHTSYECILIDDLSTDDSASVVKNMIATDPRFRLLINTEKHYALKNFCIGITESHAQDEDVLVWVDGDDWLAHNRVLETVAATYEKTQCWVSYGNFETYPEGKKSWLEPIPSIVIQKNLFRLYQWHLSHLKTMKYKVWREIDQRRFCDSDGAFFRFANDLSIMFPAAELSGGRLAFIDEILYIYNRENAINEDKTNNALLLETDHLIRSQPPYPPLAPLVFPPSSPKADAETLYQVGNFCFTRKEFTKAALYFNESHQCYATLENCFALCLTYLKMGQFDQAKNLFSDTKKQFGSSSALDALARILAKHLP